MELLGDRESLGGFALLVVEAGQLGVEGRVVGVFGQGGGEEGLGLVGFLLVQEEMGEGCGGVAGGFGEFSGEEDVVGGLGGELESLQEFVAGGGGVGGLVDPGEGSVGSGLEGGVVGVEGGGLEEFGVGGGEVRVEEFRVGGDGAAVGGLGG